MDTASAATFMDCLDQCDSNFACSSATYQFSTQTCVLYREVGLTAPDPDYETVVYNPDYFCTGPYVGC